MHTSWKGEHSQIDFVLVGDERLRFQVSVNEHEGLKIESGVVQAAAISDLVAGKTDEVVMYDEMGSPTIKVRIDADRTLLFLCLSTEIKVPAGSLFPMTESA